jgi:hypothetical protein
MTPQRNHGAAIALFIAAAIYAALAAWLFWGGQ